MRRPQPNTRTHNLAAKCPCPADCGRSHRGHTSRLKRLSLRAQDVVESGRARESVLAPSSSSHHGAHSAAEGSRLTAASSKARRLSGGASTHGASTHASTQLAPPPKSLLPALEEEQHGVQVRPPARPPPLLSSNPEHASSQNGIEVEVGVGLDGEEGEAEEGGDAWMGEALWPRQALKEYFELLTALQENMREYEDLQVRDAQPRSADRNGCRNGPEPHEYGGHSS